MAKEIVVNDKILDVLTVALSPNTRLLTLEGTIRSGKSLEMITAFFYKIYTERHHTTHCICALDIGTVRDNLLTSEIGLLTRFGAFCTLEKGKIGRYYVKLKGLYHTHRIYLCGYDNETRWKKVLGGTICHVLIDEANIANDKFIDEIFTRQASCESPLTMFSLNGDDPAHFLYKRFINKSTPIGEVPASILAELETPNKGYYYTHWTFKDNPIMTADKIKILEQQFPVGSHYYQTRVKGERGAPGELIYVDYLSKEHLVNSSDYDFIDYTIGIDIGASRAYSVFVLTGWTADYKEAIVVDVEAFQQVGYAEKTNKLISFLQKHKGKKIYGIYADTAEANYIADLRPIIRARFSIDMPEWDKPPIKHRIDAGVVCFARKKWLFDKQNAMCVYEAFRTSCWEKDKIGKSRLDTSDKKMDLIDAFEYSIRPRMRTQLSAIKTEVI